MGTATACERRLEPMVYKTIKACEQLSGEPVIINTSFNLRKEPMVNTPKDSLRAFWGDRPENRYMKKGSQS